MLLTPLEIRIAVADPSGRLDALATIVDAFRDDPACRVFWPDDSVYGCSFPRFVELFGGPALVDRTKDGAGAAFWLPPGIEADPEPVLAHLEDTIPDDRKAALFAGFEAQAALHPEEPHWYLPFIGVRAEARSQGLGAALLAYGLTRADEDGLPAYLEATSRLSIPLYRRFGFETIGVVESAGYPEITAMRRPAKLASCD